MIDSSFIIFIFIPCFVVSGSMVRFGLVVNADPKNKGLEMFYQFFVENSFIFVFSRVSIFAE